MNIYILVEGDKSEMQFYPYIISQKAKNLTRVSLLSEVKANNYIIISGGGIPSINTHTINAIKEINNHPLFDYLIVCVDGEEIGIERRKNKILDFIKESGIILNKKCILKIIVQNVCIETWFLGNKRNFKRNPQSEILRKFILHYNVNNDDPEQMNTINTVANKATFHTLYLKHIFKEHNQNYSKSKPDIVLHKTFLEELEKRFQETNHIISYSELLKLLEDINEHS